MQSRIKRSELRPFEKQSRPGFPQPRLASKERIQKTDANLGHQAGTLPLRYSYPTNSASEQPFFNTHRWDENAGLWRDAIRSQVIDALEAQEIKETGNEEDSH
jgi:hypothetical protein